MSKKVEVSLEFIQQAYNTACAEWKEKIKENIPEFAKRIAFCESGDRFTLGRGENYIICRTESGPSKINLINLQNGNLWDADSVESKNYPSISHEEFLKLCKGYTFEKMQK